ncbi:putative quinol monooxygenase [Pseudoclavibacter sp. VKM Ac-2888]|uniref:putative quinol monooxygenase n=1 Tax=Pseudoclavibacter sp. VKM Ac-2888 TaxID=2783830 RepID=UPI00188D0488|nr:antibiotic biosynthesis monooxygenase [Pseudoclavibacter sp. VKM Ac-2888]MBF4551491.1 antibiotic biosynthesis monooxygenase [Pseudoclavibacter sp. VKM Ac-2888]
MFSVWVTVEVQEQHVSEFLAAITENAESSVRDEVGCLSFDVIEIDREARQYGFYEIYRDEVAFTLEHRRAAHYATWKDVAARALVPGSQVITTGDRFVAITSR